MPPIQNNAGSGSHVHSLAAPHARDVENAITPELREATTKAMRRAAKWEIAEGAVTLSALLASIAMAGVQLANRTNGLQTPAEKLAAATIALNAGDLLFTCAANACGAAFRSAGRNGIAIALDSVKLSALSLGIAECALVLQDPSKNSGGKPHEGAAIATLGLIGGAFIMNAAKWLGTPKFKKVNAFEEAQLADIRNIH